MRAEQFALGLYRYLVCLVTCQKIFFNLVTSLYLPVCFVLNTAQTPGKPGFFKGSSVTCKYLIGSVPV